MRILRNYLPLKTVLGAVALLALGLTAPAQDAANRSPATSAYVLVVRADQARDAGELEQCLKFYQAALQQYRTLSRQDPGWNPDIVAYRTTYCANQIEAIQAKMRGPEATDEPEAASYYRAKYEALVKENEYLHARMAEMQEQEAEPDPMVLKQLEDLSMEKQRLEGELASVREQMVDPETLLRAQAATALLQDQIKVLQTQLNEATDPEQLREAEEQIRMLNSERARMKDEIDVARHQHREQAKAALELDRQVVQLQDRLVATSQALKQAQIQPAVDVGQVDVLKQENAELIGQLEKALADLDTARTRSESQKSELDLISSDMGRLLRVEREAGEEKSRQREKEAAHMQEIDQLKAEIQRLGDAAVATSAPADPALQQELDAARKALATATTDQTGQQQRLEQLEAGNQDLQQQLQQAQKLLKEGTGDQDKWLTEFRTTEVKPLQKVNQDLRDTNQALMQERADLAAGVTESEEAFAAWAQERQRMQERVTNLEDHLALAARDMQRRMNQSVELDQARNSLEELQAALKEARKASGDFEGERKELLDQLEKLRQDQANAQRPAQIQGWLDAATEHVQAGRLNEAGLLYEQVLQGDPESAAALKGYSRCLLGLGELEHAEEVLKEAGKLYPRDLDLYVLDGMVTYQQGDYKEAASILAKVVKKDGARSTARNALGAAYMSLEDYPRALEQFQEALATQPDLADAHYNLAQLLRVTEPENRDAVRTHYQRALELGSAPSADLDTFIAK